MLQFLWITCKHVAESYVDDFKAMINFRIYEEP